MITLTPQWLFAACMLVVVTKRDMHIILETPG
jgi:hypothetical protein